MKRFSPLLAIALFVGLVAPASAGHSRLDANTTVFFDTAGEPVTKYSTIVVDLRGLVNTPKNCRAARDITFKYRTVGGRRMSGESYPSNRRGKFHTEFSFHYSFTDEDGFHDGEVDAAGGPVTIRMSSPRHLKQSTGVATKHPYCPKLTGTATANVPPAPPDPAG